MKATVLLGSNRPGGVDVSFAGLRAQTFQDFEIVFVDGHYHERHTAVLDYAKAVGLKAPLYHVPNHRYHERGSIWGVACSGYNTGFMLAAGELVVMLLDFAYVAPDWLENHVRCHEGHKRLVMAPHIYLDMPPLSIPTTRFEYGAPETTVENILRQKESLAQSSWPAGEISIFAEPFSLEMLSLPRQQGDPKAAMATGPAPWPFTDHPWDLFHTKNESFPTEAILNANGMDEHYDRGRGPGDGELGWRLVQQGLEGWICAEAPALCFNPRQVLPNMNIVSPVDRSEGGRWGYEDKGHPYYLQAVASGVVKAPNPYDLREGRDAIWHWRGLSQVQGTVIPKVEISDEDYFDKGNNFYDLYR